MKIDIPLFLKGEDVSHDPANPTLGVVVGVELRPKEELAFRSQEDKYELALEIEGNEFVWTANKTSMRALAGKFGKETDAWKNKPVKMWSTQQTVGKELRWVVTCVPGEV